MQSVWKHVIDRKFAPLMALGAMFGTVAASQAALAFPGAQGWGKNATGGGQNPQTKVFFVTSLEDSGPGTLREALMQKGPRIILFKTGGVIALQSRISFSQGDVTIAGQTAPGDGVIVRNFPIRIGANNVIMRGLRIRNGDGAGPKGDLRDSIQISRVTGEPIHDVIVDHCSFGWSVDEMAEFWYGCHNVTLSYNVFSEALWKSIHAKGSHGYALLFGNGPNNLITLHHNLFAHNERRNPWIKDNAKIEMVNNVVYNWGTEALGLWSGPEYKPVFANVIGNVFKGGVDSNIKTPAKAKSIGIGKPAAPGSKFYIHDNIGPGRTEETQDDWDIVALGGQDAALYRLNAPLLEIASGLMPQKAAGILEKVLQNVGAWPRDAADKRAIEDTRNGTGKHLDNLEQIGGYPAYAVGTYPRDSDDDGMPDEWENKRGLNAQDKSDATKLATSGYLNIEEYINSLLPTPPVG